MRNIEIKARVKHLGKLLELARKLSGSNGEIIEQYDTFYNVNNGRLKLRKFEDGQSELIYYERQDTEGPKLSTFTKASFPSSSEDLHKVLEKALGTAGIVRKTRHLFMVGQTRVHVDSVEGLGDFMELEVMLEDLQKPEEGESIAKALMESLGVEETQLLSGAYNDLLKARDQN